MGRIILASGSPRRQWLLRQIGLEPEVVVSQVEELMTDKEPDWSRYGGGCGWENPGEACLGL